MRVATPALPLVLGVLWLASCGDDFRPASELTEAPQILAVRTSPPEAAPGDTVTLDALVHWPADNPATLWWLVCDPEVGDDLTSCVANRLEEDTPPLCSTDPEARLCLAGIGDRATLAVPRRGNQADPHTVYISVLATSTLDDLESCGAVFQGAPPDERCQLALKRLIVVDSLVTNQNPVVERLEIAAVPGDPSRTTTVLLGELDPEQFALPVSVHVDPLSVDELDPLGEASSYELVVSWFTSCGRPEPDRQFVRCTAATNGEPARCEASTVWWQPGRLGDCTVHAVVRDLRGGTGFLSQTIRLQ